MGWGGATGFSPVVGIFFFTGPVLLLFAMVFEWVMGNFFPMMVMGLFAVFWLSFGMLQLPTLGLALPYATEADPTGMSSPQYNAVIALYLLVWGFALFTFFIFTCKINAVFASIFGLVTTACWVLSGAYWKVTKGEFEMAGRLQTVSPGYPLDLMCERKLTDYEPGRWCPHLCRGNAGMVHDVHHHGRRDAALAEASCRRPEPILATN
jgi:uncharacterized protein